jgi:hypothetical protein
LRSRRRRSKKRVEKSGLGELRLFGAIVLLAAIAYFLKDFYGVQYRLIGSYVWAMAFLLAFVLGLFYFVQFLLPLDWQDSWFEGLRMTLSYNFPYVASLLVGGVSRAPAEINKADVPPGLTVGFVRHRAGNVQSHYLLVLSKGALFTRAAGPGYVSLNRGENVSQVIDLRRHLRTLSVKALTRDGIPVETVVSVVFQVKQEDPPLDPDMPYPYDAPAIFHVNYLGNFHTGEGSVPWTRRVVRQANSGLIAELSRYTLDELSRPDRSSAPPMEAIEGRVKRQLATTFDQHGITILALRVGQVKVPEDVVEQRIKNWQSGWQSRILADSTLGEAEAVKRVKLARARAQIEIIENLTENIEAMHRSGQTNLTDVVALRMIEALNEASADETVRALVPQQATVTLEQLEAWLQEKGETQ